MQIPHTYDHIMSYVWLADVVQSESDFSLRSIEVVAENGMSKRQNWVQILIAVYFWEQWNISCIVNIL